VITDVLAGLDDEQRAVAEALHGPVVVLAGAGTGKTRAITHRIAYGAATGQHDPRRTLAVTFTTRAAGEMRSRLRSLGVDGVQVRTFHAAALRQLRYFLDRRFGRAVPEIIPSKARLVAEAAKRCNLPSDAATVRDMSSALEWLVVSEGRPLPSALGKGDWQSMLPQLQRAYVALKDERSVFDFEDILLTMTRLIEDDPGIADEIRAAYRWFTVDEYQDISPLQHRLLRQWLGDRDDLCVVGDANQTIYSFAGATPEYLSGFRAAFPDATEVRLQRCYRCTPEIVEVANAVIASAHGATSLVLSSQRAPGVAPTVRDHADDIDEANDLARRIQRYLDEGRSPRDIAVLYRINRQSEPLEEALAEAGIPAVLRGTERFFDRAEVREATTRLRGAARAGEANGPLAEAVRAVLGSMGWSVEAPRSAGAVRERWESLAALVTLAEELAPTLGDSLAAFVAELDSRAEVQHAPVADGVTLATVHAAKGLEWPIVFIVGFSDDLMPFDVDDADIEEERRLAYVAITRAADALHISWAAARQPGGRSYRRPSRFLVDALAGSSTTREARSGGVVRKGSGRPRGERSRKGPARCRVCRKGLVTAPERTLGRCQACPADLDVDLLDALRAWRLEISRARQVPAYVVFTDVTLLAIAEQRPSDRDALAEIPGIGPAKLEAYGDDVLAMVGARD